MNANDIKDEDSLRQWLEIRSQAECIAIVHRAALRMIPVWGGQMGQDWARKEDLSALPILQANLNAGVARKYPTPEVKSVIARLTGYPSSALNCSRRISLADGSRAAISQAADTAAANSKFAAGLANPPSATSAAAIAGRSFRATSHSIRPAIWGILRAECQMLERGGSLDGLALWLNGENLFQTEWAETQAIWAAQGDAYAFWLRWYEAALQGNHLNPELERDIALIPDADWEKGAEHIAAIIAELESKHREPRASLDEELSNLPAPAKTKVTLVQRSIAINHALLPATFDAIEGYICLEIERLQARNYQSEQDAQECHRQIATLNTLYSAISRMRMGIPVDGAVTLPQAIEIEKLSRLYLGKLCALPRSKSDEVVEGVWAAGKGMVQVGLIGATSAILMTAFGLPALAATAIGTMVFAPKIVPDVIKAGIEVAKSQAKP